MTKTINVGRNGRVGNDETLSGSEAISVNTSAQDSQEINAGVVEEITIGGFKDHQLQAIELLADIAVTATFLGDRFAIADLNVVGPDTCTYVGDTTDDILPGDLIMIEGTVADDGVYEVGVHVAATITLSDGNLWPVGAGGAVGTFARVASRQRIGYGYAVLAIVQATGAITYTGNVSDKFAAGEALTLSGTAANDGYWRINSVAFAGGVTTIIVLDEHGVVGLAADAGAVGQFQKTLPGFMLTANEPFLWTEGGGMDNPFIGPNTDEFAAPLFNADRGDVVYLMVDNTANALTAANVRTIIGTNSIL